MTSTLNEKEVFTRLNLSQYCLLNECLLFAGDDENGKEGWGLLPPRNSQLAGETSLACMSQLKLCIDRWNCGGEDRPPGVLGDPGFPELLLSHGAHSFCKDNSDLAKTSTFLISLVLYRSS